MINKECPPFATVEFMSLSGYSKVDKRKFGKTGSSLIQLKKGCSFNKVKGSGAVKGVTCSSYEQITSPSVILVYIT